jgi:GMP synthase PP-ATPase subunit
MSSYAGDAVESIRKKAAGKEVLLALSGGVDSSVAAALVSRARRGQAHLHFRPTTGFKEKTRRRGGGGFLPPGIIS